LRDENIPLLVSRKSAPSSRHPASSKRGVRVVTIRGVRGAVDAMAPARARHCRAVSGFVLEAVSNRSAQDERRYCVRQKRVVLAPVAGVKLAEADRIQPGSLGRQSGSDGGKRNSSPGRARHKPSNHCAGKAGCSPLDLYARVRTSLCHCTRDRGCSAHPVFPAPSHSRGQAASYNSGASRRGNALAYPHLRPDTISADNHPELSLVATCLALRNISALAKAALTGQKKSRKKKRQRRTI
jgi:hypothetical protein